MVQYRKVQYSSRHVRPKHVKEICLMAMASWHEASWFYASRLSRLNGLETDVQSKSKSWTTAALQPQLKLQIHKKKHKLAQNWLGCTATKQCAPKSKIHRDDLVQQVQGLCLFAVHEHGWKAKAKAVRIHGFLHHEVACWYEPDVGMKLVRNWNGLVTCVSWPMLIKSNHYVDVSHLVVS